MSLGCSCASSNACINQPSLIGLSAEGASAGQLNIQTWAPGTQLEPKLVEELQQQYALATQSIKSKVAHRLQQQQKAGQKVIEPDAYECWEPIGDVLPQVGWCYWHSFHRHSFQIPTTQGAQPYTSMFVWL